MSTVVVDIDNQYEDDLCYGYQLLKEDDSTYSVWVETGVLRGYHAAKGMSSFQEAFDKLQEVFKDKEYY